jgi:N-acyl-D-aspartate/D-glutamate deacylase
VGRARGILILAAAAALAGARAQPEFDLLVRGGTVVDGTGAAGYRADVAVRGDRIVLVTREAIDAARARRVLDAEGRIVAPGFIDAHSHSDNLADRPLAEGALRQGVTTLIYAADGGMPWPLPRQIETLRTGGHAPNIVFFAGFNTARSRVLGSVDRAPTPAELEEMKAMIAQAMDAGAIGMSSGLRYTPAIYASTEEVIALARVAAQRGGIYSSHMRDEGAGSLDAVRELIRIAREAGMPAQITHHKLMGQPQWGQSVQTLALVDAARAEGLDITIDAYPYDATSTGTAVLFPPWALAGGGDSLRARLADPAQRARIETGMREIILEERGGGDLARIRIARYGRNSSWNGKTFADIAAERGREPTLDFAVELGIEIQMNGGASGVWHVVDEADVRRVLQHPWTMIGSDGALSAPGEGHPHPRNYGAFARVLGRYVREYGVLTLEDAIRKMTSLPAWRFGQTERGRIAEGAYADIAVFNAQTIIDRATYEEPHQYAIGVDHVVVNGVVVIESASLTGERPGRVLRRPATRPPAHR